MDRGSPLALQRRIMTKRVAVAVGGIWLAAIASAVLLAFTLNRPLVLRPVASEPWRAKVLETRTERPSAEDESAFLEMPTLFVVAAPSAPSPSSSGGQGIAEMQKSNEPTVGPGDPGDADPRASGALRGRARLK
jgi:hypothetical protein